MRVLTVCVDTPGHVNPLLPLAAALARQGDDVVITAGPGAVALAEAAGIPSQVVGHGFDGWFGQLVSRTRGTPGEGLPPERIQHYFQPRLFAEIGAADMIDALVAIPTPDLVVFEGYAYAAALAAAIVDVPAVCLQVGFQPPNDVSESVADSLAPLWRACGQPADRKRAVFGDVLLRTPPPSLEPAEAPVPAMSVRPTEPPATAPRPEEPPLVHVTAGTAPHRDLEVVRRVLAALRDEPVQVLATVGSDASAERIGDVPANARVLGYASYPDLLPRCSAVVHHGGAGTMYAALAHGLPAIVTPSGADQFANAARLQAAGVAVVLDAASSPEAIRAAVHTALQDEAMRGRPRQVAAEIAAMPDVATVAAALRTLAAQRRERAPAV